MVTAELTLTVSQGHWHLISHLWFPVNYLLCLSLVTIPRCYDLFTKVMEVTWPQRYPQHYPFEAPHYPCEGSPSCVGWCPSWLICLWNLKCLASPITEMGREPRGSCDPDPFTVLFVTYGRGCVTVNCVAGSNCIALHISDIGTKLVKITPCLGSGLSYIG